MAPEGGLASNEHCPPTTETLVPFDPEAPSSAKVSTGDLSLLSLRSTRLLPTRSATRCFRLLQNPSKPRRSDASIDAFDVRDVDAYFHSHGGGVGPSQDGWRCVGSSRTIPIFPTPSSIQPPLPPEWGEDPRVLGSRRNENASRPFDGAQKRRTARCIPTGWETRSEGSVSRTHRSKWEAAAEALRDPSACVGRFLLRALRFNVPRNRHEVDEEPTSKDRTSLLTARIRSASMRNLQWSLEARTRKFFRGRSVLLPLLALLALVLFPLIYAISSWFGLDEIQSTTTQAHTAPLQVPKRDPNNYPLVADYTSSRLDMGDSQPCLKSDEYFDAAHVQWAVGKLAEPELMKFGTSSSSTELVVIQHLANFHRAVGICGPLIEIGVYKGWFVAVLSSLLARDSEKVFAFDLYNMQEANVDNSGGGKVHVPLVKYFWMIVHQLHSMEKVITVQANSLDLSADAILSMVGYKPRFISVDGGHFRIATFHDMNIASRILHPEGVIAVDDYNNYGWKGVKIAVATFIAVWPEDLQPFLATDAKLYMCKKNQHQKFLSEAQRWFPGSKTCPGHSLNFSADDRVSLNHSSISEFVDQTNNANRGKFC